MGLLQRVIAGLLLFDSLMWVMRDFHQGFLVFVLAALYIKISRLQASLGARDQ